MEDIFEQSIPDACKTLTSQLKSKQLPVEAICPVLQKALNQHISTVDSVLSSHILAFLSELQVSKAPPVLGRELLQAVIAVQGGIQGKRALPAEPFTVYFREHWEELPAILLKPFSLLIDREAGPGSEE